MICEWVKQRFLRFEILLAILAININIDYVWSEWRAGQENVETAKAKNISRND